MYCLLRHTLIAGGIAVLQSIGVASAEPTIIRYSQPQEKTIITQRVVTLRARAYQPPYEVPILESVTDTSYQTPEAVLSADASALARRDREASLQFLDEKVKARRRAEKAVDPAAYAKTKQQGIDLGEAVFTKGKVVLRERVDVPGLTVIFADIVSKTTGKVVLRLPFSFRQENGKWKLTEPDDLDNPINRALYSEYPLEGNVRHVDEGYVLQTHRPRETSFRLENPPPARKK